jgi:hypothetical protein
LTSLKFPKLKKMLEKRSGLSVEGRQVKEMLNFQARIVILDQPPVPAPSNAQKE